MAEPFETLREVGVALDGFRSEVKGQFATLKWIMSGVAAVGILISGVLVNKVDALEESAARNTAILERIDKAMGDVAANTDEIKESIQSASAAPTAPAPALISGWKGVPLAQYQNFEEVFSALSTPTGDLMKDAWVYFPESQ